MPIVIVLVITQLCIFAVFIFKLKQNTTYKL